jgi:type VI secretion system protein ImpB
MSSVHGKLSRVRKPRVHITYDVEVGDATEKKEIPFVVGVIGDFSGKPTKPLPQLRDRKFVQIDRDNIDQVLKSMTPGLTLEVANTLSEEPGKNMKVNLKFESMEDFEPAKIVQQVEPLKNLLDIRNQLKELMNKVDVSTDLESTLEEVLKKTENVEKLASELGLPTEGSE